MLTIFSFQTPRRGMHLRALHLFLRGTSLAVVFVAMSNILDGIERLHQALDYHLERQNLLTANLTHVDTPGYKPLDLERGAAFQGELESAMATTDSGHIASSAQGPDFRVVEDTSGAVGMDGNGVSIDREAVKIAANHVRYEALAGLVQGSLSSLAWAANDGKG